MKLPGEVKKVVAVRQFELNGRDIPEGAEIEIDQATCYELCNLRNPPIRMLRGSGVFNIERNLDGYHRIEMWNWPGRPTGFSTSDRFVRVEFLRDVDWLLCKAGDRRRIRLSIVCEYPHKYLNSPPPSPYLAIPQEEPIFLIKENRPGSPSEDTLAMQEIDAAKRAALNGPSWVHGTVNA